MDEVKEYDVIKYLHSGKVRSGIIIKKRFHVLQVLPVSEVYEKDYQIIKPWMVKGKFIKNGATLDFRYLTTIDQSRISQKIGYIKSSYQYVIVKEYIGYIAKHLRSEEDLFKWLWRMSMEFDSQEWSIMKSYNIYEKKLKEVVGIVGFPKKSYGGITEGDILLVDFNLERMGFEIKKERYGVVLAINDKTMLVAPISSRKDNRDYHVYICPEDTRKGSELICEGSVFMEQIRTIVPEQVHLKVGRCNNEYIDYLKFKLFSSSIDVREYLYEIFAEIVMRFIPQKDLTAAKTEKILEINEEFFSNIQPKAI